MGTSVNWLPSNTSFSIKKNTSPFTILYIQYYSQWRISWTGFKESVLQYLSETINLTICLWIKGRIKVAFLSPTVVLFRLRVIAGFPDLGNIKMCSLQLPGFLTMAMLAGECWELTSMQFNLSKLRTQGYRNWSPFPLRVSDWGKIQVRSLILRQGESDTYWSHHYFSVGNNCIHEWV